MKAFLRNVRAWLFCVASLLVGARQHERKVRIISLQLAHEAGMKDGLSLEETMRVASAYHLFALCGDNPFASEVTE
jgi:hypothetical protein